MEFSSTYISSMSPCILLERGESAFHAIVRLASLDTLHLNSPHHKTSAPNATVRPFRDSGRTLPASGMALVAEQAVAHEGRIVVFHAHA